MYAENLYGTVGRQTMLRVLQVVTKMDRCGLETLLMNYYRNIDREIIQFDFLTHREEHGQYDDEIEQLGGNIYHVPHLNPLNPGYYKALDDFFRTQPYNIVHSHLDCTSTFPLRAAKKANVPNRIAHIHNTNQDRDIKYPIKMISKKLMPYYATDFFACGKAAGEWAFAGRKFTVMKNAIDTTCYAFNSDIRVKIRNEFGLRDEFLVGHVGRFDPQKNHKFLLKIFAKLKKLNPTAKLMLVGNGNGRDEIVQMAERMGLKDAIIFTGVRADVNELMQAMDVFVLPSLYEGLPVTMVEAQAAGLPCVISDKVPTECAIVDGLVKSVALSDDLSIWVDALQKAKNIERKDHTQEISEKGYDIKQAADWLKNYYISLS